MLELAVVAACWLFAYLVRFHVLPTPVDLVVPDVMDYLLPLPLIVGVWFCAARMAGLCSASCREPVPHTWAGLGGVVAVEGIVLLAVLRGMHSEPRYSRIVMAIFLVSAFVTVAGFRRALASRAHRAQVGPKRNASIRRSDGSTVVRLVVRYLLVPARLADAIERSQRQRALDVNPTLVAIGDIFVVATAWLAAYFLHFGLLAVAGTPRVIPKLLEHVYHLPAVLCLYVMAFRVFGLYGRARNVFFGSEWATILKASTLATLLAVIVLRVLPEHPSSGRTVLVYFWFVSILMLALRRTVRFSSWRVSAVALAAAVGHWFRATSAFSAQAFAFPRFEWRARIRAMAAPPLAGVAALVLGLLWYGWYLSFPLIGEDGAALYSFLMESIRSAGPWTSLFPVKWLEGLGQPNVFVSATFDPFAWVLRLPLASADAFRLSYALRAALCWLTTYLFARLLFRSARAVAVTAAFLALLLNFILTHPWGIPSFAGIFIATHVAVFPGLLCLYWLVARSPAWLGWRDVTFGLGLAWFLLMYPLGSLLGVAVLAAFGVSVAATRRGGHRQAATLALAKLGAWTAVVLFAPVYGLYHAWSAVVSVSARNVFADELTTYPHTYLLPHLWHDVPLGVRLVVFLAVSLLLLSRRRLRSLEPVLVTGALILIGAQAATVMRATAILAPLMDRLPRPFYVEYYLPLFYCVAAAYTLHRLGRLWSGLDFSDGRWPYRLAGFVSAAWLFLGSGVALAASVLGLRPATTSRYPVRVRHGTAIAPAIAVVGLFAGAVATWTLWPQNIHPVFADELLCRDRDYWCRDVPGRTMGADRSPLTEFLRARLTDHGVFRGRADFVLSPAPRVFGFPAGEPLTADDFEALQGWYQRALRALVPPVEPQPFSYAQGADLVSTVGALVATGEIPDDVLAEVVQWAQRRSPGLRVASGPDAWRHTTEVSAVVQERNRNFRLTGNGMLQRALPYQGVPIASSYEQALDYLYFLFWTRYVNAGIPARRSINMTVLETVYPERLALIGVRYVIARDSPYVEAPPLPRVFAWRGYSIYEVPQPNTAGYAPTRIIFAGRLLDELRAMRDPAFDPRRDAVMPESVRGALFRIPLAPMHEAKLSILEQTLRFEATSSGWSLAVLPFKFSHCWRPRWQGVAGHILRVDGFLIGVLFEEKTRVDLSWTAGYGPLADCVRADTALVEQAIVAATGLR